DAARETIERGLREHPDNPSLLYDLACLEALSGDQDAAVEHLRRALELKPDLAGDARADDDFASIRDRSDFPA
ncbi:MAG TPA: tetratricopeptide repeat protein, partial [Gaiellaceae bacterium]